jgi:hypothetical protein
MGFFNWLFGKRRKTEPPPSLDSAPEPGTDGVDPRAVGNVESLMREAKELPIGEVRGHAVAHFKVVVRGGYFLNGKRVSLEEMRRECARLVEIGGAVFYYRENTGEDGGAEAEELIAAICQARLPLTFAGRDYDPEVKVTEYFLPAEAWPALADNTKGGA